MNLKISRLGNISFSTRQWNLIFLVAIIWLTWMYGSFNTLDRGPYSRHIWRQADCLAITKSYYNDHLPFLEPEVYIQYEGNPGKTISELPIVYYGVAQIWRLTGEHYWIYRLLSLVVFLIGILYLKRLSFSILQDHFWSIFVALFLYTSPLIAYYSNNYLMNTYALSLAIIGTYHFHQYYLKLNYKHLLFACILFLFAGLLKITALLIFLAIGGAYVYHNLFKKKNLKGLISLGVPYLTVLLIILAWQGYVSYYNNQGVAKIFLQGILPIWEIDKAQIIIVWKKLWNDLLPEVYGYTVLFLLGILILLLVLNHKKTTSSFFTVMLFTLLGIIGYILLFYQVFDVHEYYLTNLLIIVPIILLLGLDLLRQHFCQLFQSAQLKMIALIILISMSYYAIVNTRVKYDAMTGWINNSFLLSTEKQGLWEWSHWNYNRTLKELETIEPLLDSVGCTYEKRVLSIPDNTINASLVIMNRKGYTNYNYYQEAELITKSKEWGAQFLIVNGLEELEKPYLKPFLADTIAKTEFVTVIRL